MTVLTRRTLVQAAAAFGGVTMLPGRRAFGQTGAAPADPHFFLQVFVPFSFDASYLFDSRPRALTAAGMIQNYFLQANPTYDPVPWVGSNGVQSLASVLASTALGPFKSHFSVLNGVLMSTDFDGHDQNQAFAMTGNALGGESYLPHLNEIGLATPLDYLQFSQLQNVDVTNAGSSVQLTAASAKQLSITLKNSSSVAATDPAIGMVNARVQAGGGGPGLFAQGAARLGSGLGGSFGLGAKLKGVDVSGLDGLDELAQELRLINQYFLNGITRSALLVLDKYNADNDCHSGSQAKKQPDTYAAILKDLGQIFTYLTQTPFGAGGKSLMDVTTVVVMAEFNRTMRQTGQAIDGTGTDHNTLANEVLIAGKGIKGGMVIGGSDLEALGPDGKFTNVAGAHVERDPTLLKIMGKPFDFASMKSTNELPTTYDATKYLTFASVANTIYKVFGAKTSHYRQLFRNGPIASTLDGLLT